jgi:hypothetical protein
VSVALPGARIDAEALDGREAASYAVDAVRQVRPEKVDAKPPFEYFVTDRSFINGGGGGPQGRG